MLKLFSGWDDIESELRGDEINRIDNILTLSPEVHRFFGRMKGWLEAKEVSRLLISLKL